jgi:hypothetical protein
VKERNFQATSTAIFDKSLPSNVKVNNISNFIRYSVDHHGVLLASEDFYHLSSLYKKFKNRWLKEFADKKSLVIIFYITECGPQELSTQIIYLKLSFTFLISNFHRVLNVV